MSEFNKNTKKQAQNKMHIELIESIRKNLNHGDVLSIALQNGFSRSRAENVMRLRTKCPIIIKALFEKAMENKRSLKVLDYQKMINDLNNN